MMKMSFLAAAAATAMLAAAPGLATAATKDATQSMATRDANSSAAHARQTMHRQQMTHPKRAMRKHMSRMGPDRYDRSRNATYQEEWNRTNTGFVPFDVAGNVVGGAIGTAGAIAGTAVGTAGAIAAAPFGRGPYGYEDSYAYDTESDIVPGRAYADYGYNGDYQYSGVGYPQSYAARNGFVCQPGVWYTNDYGIRQLCQ